MTQTNRIDGGLIDRSKALNFTFDGDSFEGYGGDTLASALLANGQKLVGRSFKYHRPRGILTAGSEEPNALVQLRSGAFQEPNTRATVAELFEGLEATSQNHRGSLKYDLMAFSDLLSPFLGAGFYYKTFMWPKSFWEKFYEPVIRNAAGLGSLSMQPDPDKYDKGYLHCDLLIIGAGPSGLSAALQAGRCGARVILADEDFISGGRLNSETFEIDGVAGSQWASNAIGELQSMDNVQLLTRTTVYGAYDHGVYGALESIGDHEVSDTSRPRQILWRIYSKQAILAAGATERPIAFANNDRPGIMLAGAVRSYVNRWGVASGKRVSLFTNCDDGWRTATDLIAKGIEIAAVIDSRDIAAPMTLKDTRIVMGGRIIDSKGRHAVKSITLSGGQKIDTDCVAVSGGWSPNVHLTCHQGGRPQWRDDICAFVPGSNIPKGMIVTGAANGAMTLAAGVKDGIEAAAKAVDNLGFKPAAGNPPKAEDEASGVSAFWHVDESKGRAWLDFQNDVTVKDVRLAYQEGYRSVEHLKRYTTLGMATDQGKTANIPALAIMAQCTGKSIEDTGTTVFRPPYTPIAIGAMGGRSRGKDYQPVRYTSGHNWAKEHGAIFVETGLWLRAQWFPIKGETHWRQSVDREVLQTRKSVGLCDVSTLGKIDVQGKDAAEFLNRIYVNGFAKLAVGKCRYGLMLREDGIAMDDGTAAHLAQNHFVVTTTTANAAGVFRHMEFCRQCLWPQMDVHLVSVSEQWAQYSVAGPNARKLLEKLVDSDADISNEAFPFMACGEISVCDGIIARLFRISFSGELAYEIAIPARYGDGLIRALMRAGEEFDCVTYGIEALGVMRIEKGHATGNELTGQITARDLGMARMVSSKKDFIGNILAKRKELNREDGLALVGFIPVDRDKMLSAGAHFIPAGKNAVTENDEGWMTSVAFSPTLGHSIGLGFIKGGAERLGEVVQAFDRLRGNDTDGEIDVEIVSPHFVDPQGERLRG